MATSKINLPKNNNSQNEAEEWNKLFPLVAIGASAGGLQAIFELLKYLPSDLGFAYVIIQHLSPTHESILPELLEKKTKMKVHQVKNGMKLHPNNVYVIPPNSYLGIVDSKLKTLPRPVSNISPHSIDFFLDQVAPIYQSKAVAIILSGSGNDGSAGIQSIKAFGGITFAQDETAAFLSMPKVASDSGFTDFVMPCEQIAAELTEMAKNPEGILTLNEVIDSKESDLKKIKHLLYTKKDVDFGYYKQTTVNRRIMRRMTINKFKNLSDYLKFLRENPEELEHLYKDLLINVTSFFREPLMFDILSKKFFPLILKDKKENEVIRIWTPACATGEEAYSFAICLYDHLKDKAFKTAIQIFGTDLNDAAIEKARAGIYSKASLSNVSPERLKRYFIKIDGGHYQIIKSIRDCCIFATHNLLKDPPFSRMDLISCQNVMIYLEAAPQKKILQAFHYALKESGYLLLGKSETIGNLTELYAQAEKEVKIYSKKNTARAGNLSDISFNPFRLQNAASPQERKFVPQNIQIDIDKETERLLLSRYVPASVVINKDMQIVRFQGATSRYLQPSSGKASLHLLKMVKDELIIELKGLINKVKKEEKNIKKENVQLSFNGSFREIDIEVVPLASEINEPHYLIIFKETDAGGKYHAGAKSGAEKQKNDPNAEAMRKMEQQVIDAREYMKNMSEEFEATREELQSANEEILSSNEELQSINEELETSKEELLSTNEELSTINDELQHRNNELREMSDYLQAIVETIKEPILVINSDTRISTANKAYYTVFKTDADKTEGNFLFETGNYQWNISELKEKINAAINKGITFENFEITHVFSSLGQKTLLFSAMQMPLQNGKKNKILLVVEDISNGKKAELEFKESEERFRLLVENASDIITIYSKEGVIKFQSGSVQKILDIDPQENTGKNIFRMNFLHPDDILTQQKIFEEVIDHPGKNIKSKFRLKHRNGKYKLMEVIFRNLLDVKSIEGIVANYHDISDM